MALQVTDTVRYEGNVAVLKRSTTSSQRPRDRGEARLVDYSGNRPTNVPQQVINNWLSWAFMPQWEAHVGIQWVGPIYNNDANTVKRRRFTVVNLGLDYDVTKSSEIALWVFNAFDEVYAVGGKQPSGSWRRRARLSSAIASSTDMNDLTHVSVVRCAEGPPRQEWRGGPSKPASGGCFTPTAGSASRRACSASCGSCRAS